ncbi:hypothetical protein [Caulobacter sp. NIBR2454]|uniref:hypothetical protein n=1 Tax=Caulobacter sp. NIBR2454 TaxID=3015996 RepID=UPI0022B6CF13|nr:hypothetical protein [Caulobacter sp. NIBR2454]
MVLRAVGAAALAKLMKADRETDLDSEWLLFGPTDPEVVDEPEIPLLLAAE